MAAEQTKPIEVEQADDGPAPLVLIGAGKFFSNGLDLEWMSTVAPGVAERVVSGLQALLARLLAFPAYSVAALNGHAFAAGAMLAPAFDERVMRADRGLLCLLEVDLGLPFRPGMSALISHKLPPASAHRAMLTGCRLQRAAGAGRGHRR